MKDIFEILKDNGIEVPEEKYKDIRRAVSEHYKTVVEFNNQDKKLNGLLTSANDTITDLKGKLEKLDGVDVDALQQKIKDYEKAEADRVRNETAAKELQALKDRFVPLKGDKVFLNEGTESWIFEEFKNAIGLDENKSKSDAEIYEAVTKDKNIYMNPNQKLTIPPVGGSNGPQGDKAYMDQFYAENPFYKK